MNFYEDKQSLLAPSAVQLREFDQLTLSEGQFFVRSYLGTGGFGHVYLVENEDRPQRFALKLLRLWDASSQTQSALREAFTREIKAGELDSPYLVKTLGAGHLGGNPFLLMEYCSGGTLMDRLSQYEDEKAFDQLAIRLLKGLEHLHHHGMVHLDLKPSNILFDAKGQAKLADFGIVQPMAQPSDESAQQLAAHWRTALFCPPEHMQVGQAGQPLGPASDLFSFGILTYYVLSGGLYPFGDQALYESNRAQYFRHMRRGKWDDLRKHRPDLSARWPDLLRSCLQHDPRRRPTSVQALLSKISPGQVPEREVRSRMREKPWQLCLMQGVAQPQVIDLGTLRAGDEPQTLTIGAQEPGEAISNDITLQVEPGQGIDTYQATLRYQSGRWYLQHGQAHATDDWIVPESGTFVNNQYIRKGEQIPLHVGDLIRWGNLTFKVTFAAPPQW